MVGGHIVHILLDTLGIALELLPVNRVRIRAFNDVIDPCAIGGVTVGGHLDQVDRTQQPIADDLLCLLVAIGLTTLVT